MSYTPTDFSPGTTYDDVEADKMGLGIQQAHIFMDKFSGNQALPTTAGYVPVANGSLVVMQALTSSLIPGIEINSQGGNYTTVATDPGKLIVTTSGSANTVTIAPGLYTVGHLLQGLQTGAGQTSIVGGSGVTVSARGIATTIKAAGQGAPWTAVMTASNVWWVWGDITA